MRPFSDIDPALPPEQVGRAEADRLRSLATWAYLLLRPGLEFVRQRSNFILGWPAVGAAGVPPLGSWMILPDLTTPATRTVLPSHDALYGASHVELDLLGPLVVHVPANIDDRYYSVAIMDAHLNNVAHLGPRWTGNDASDHLLVPPGWDGLPPQGMPVIESPTVSACLYNRMLVGFDTGDIDRVRAWQAGLQLTQLRHWGQESPLLDEVPTDAFVHPDLTGTTDEQAYLRIGLDHLARNPLVPQALWLASLVSTAGFEAAAQDSGLAAAVREGVDEATRMLDAALTTCSRVNGWMRPDPTLGLPNPQVLRSAAYQQFQIGSNDISESAYFFLDSDGQGRPLDGSDGAVYRLRLPGGALPPVEPGGYWSLTMYGADSLLVPNPLDRYAVRVEQPGFVRDPDGGATITLATSLPPETPEATWLPAPAGRFRLGLRVYYPQPSVADGSWAPPPLVRD